MHNQSITDWNHCSVHSSNVLYLAHGLFPQCLECSVFSKSASRMFKAILDFSHSFQAVLGFPHIFYNSAFSMEMFPETSQKFQILLNHSLIVLERSNAFYAFYTHTRYTMYQICFTIIYYNTFTNYNYIPRNN